MKSITSIAIGKNHVLLSTLLEKWIEANKVEMSSLEQNVWHRILVQLSAAEKIAPTDARALV